jgi:hypothetical protein
VLGVPVVVMAQKTHIIMQINEVLCLSTWQKREACNW